MTQGSAYPDALPVSYPCTTRTDRPSPKSTACKVVVGGGELGGGGEGGGGEGGWLGGGGDGGGGDGGGGLGGGGDGGGGLGGDKGGRLGGKGRWKTLCPDTERP